MANVIKIKQGGASVTAPSAGDLKKGELGYTFNNDKLWIGSGDGGTDDAIQVSYDHPATHSIAEVSGLQTALNAKVDDNQVQTNVPSGAVFTDTTYSAGTNVSINGSNVISSTDTNTTYSAGTNMTLSGTEFSSTDTNTTYTAGANMSLTGTEFSSTDTNTTYSAGTNMSLSGTTFSSTDTTYNTATSGTLGLVKIGYTESGKNYPVELSSGKMYVNVPWSDTNTTYSNATTSAAGLMSSTDKGRLDTLHGLVATDTDGTIDKINEVFDAFGSASDDGTFDLVSQLAGKMDDGQIIDGGTF